MTNKHLRSEAAIMNMQNKIRPNNKYVTNFNENNLCTLFSKSFTFSLFIWSSSVLLKHSTSFSKYYSLSLQILYKCCFFQLLFTVFTVFFLRTTYLPILRLRISVIFFLVHLTFIHITLDFLMLAIYMLIN